MIAIWLRPSETRGWSLTRTAALLLSSLVVGLLQLHAQGTQTHLFRADAPIDATAAKWAIHAVKGLDPQGLISIENDLLKIRVRTGLGNAELLSALNSVGRHYEPVVKDADRGALDQFAMPHRIDTGDPVGDDARYEEAKRIWLEKHNVRLMEMKARGD